MEDSVQQLTLDHHGLEVLSADECWQLAADVAVGRLAFVDAGEPVILPINHRVVAHHIVFRTMAGTKLGAAVMQRPVAFEVDSWDESTRVGWSVLITGVAIVVDDSEELADLDQLGLDSWATGPDETVWVRILVSDINGRRLAS